jgi:endonuclease/exonuclease/phosphatase family metal-dependent hydrolase
MFDARAIEVLGLRPLPVRERPRDQGWRGNVLLVRRDARLPEPPVGLRLGGMEPRGAILAVLDLGEGPFRVIGTHLSLGGGTRRRQARALLEAMEHGPGRGLPTLLMGDLNEWGRRGALAVLAPAFGGMPPRAPTFPAFRPLASLDRILGRPAGIVARLRVHDTRLAREASDHLPLTARVELGGRAAAARLDGRAEGA